mgnify:CR=1 FL=1|tara:strand:+ start:448 stop:705 length:258 start_codon:yes stop_codon:yes gene_type:complete
MNTYRVDVNFNLRINAKDRNDIEAIINKLNLPNQKTIKVIKMNSNCLQCGKELLNRTASAKFCNDICRATYNNQRYKLNRERGIE